MYVSERVQAGNQNTQQSALEAKNGFLFVISTLQYLRMINDQECHHGAKLITPENSKTLNNTKWCYGMMHIFSLGSNWQIAWFSTLAI